METPTRLSPQKLSTRAHELFLQACPDSADEAFFNQNMQLAIGFGMTWVESLQYVIQKRRERQELQQAA